MPKIPAKEIRAIMQEFLDSTPKDELIAEINKRSHLPKDGPVNPAVAQLRIVCAAIRNDKGMVICGPRHYDSVMRAQIAHSGGRALWKGAVQGFVDQYGNFHTREDAWEIANNANQVIRKVGGNSMKRLFSENLY